MAKQIKTFLVIALSLLLTAGFNLVPLPASALNQTSMVLSELDGNEKLDTNYLQQCLTQESASLDVLVLMDQSSSLVRHKGQPGSDEGGLRGPMIKSALTMLADVASEQSRPMNINLRTFAKRFNADFPSLDWQELPGNGAQSESQIDELVSVSLDFDHMADQNRGTDWKSGLLRAQSQLQERAYEAQQNGEQSCQVMIWVTDGVPDPKGDMAKPSDSYREVARINKTDIATFCSGDGALMNWFRENKILVLGALLEPKYEDKDRSKIFKSIIEQRGEAPDNDEYFGGLSKSGEDFVCGKLEENWVRGKVVAAANPTELSWRFVDLIAGLSKLIDLEPDSSEFYVDPQTGHIEVFINSKTSNWSITSKNGNLICSSENLSGICEVDSAGDSITRVMINPKSDSEFGLWTVSSTPPSEIKSFAGLDGSNIQFSLNIEPLLSDIDEGEEASVHAEVAVIGGGSLDGFNQIDICANVDSSEVPNCQDNKSADLSFTPSLTDKNVFVTATLTSSYDSNRIYELVGSTPIRVADSEKFASIKCKGGEDICSLAPLRNAKDISETLFDVIAAKSGLSNTVSNLKFKVTYDPVSERLGKYAASFLLDSSEVGNSFQVNSDQQLKLVLSFVGDEKSQSASGLQGVITYDVTADGKTVTRSLGVTFETGVESNNLVRFLLMFVIYLATIALPYAFLLWSARKSAFFSLPDNQLKYFVKPIFLTLDGTLEQSGVDGETRELFSAPNFREFKNLEVATKQREIVVDNFKFEIVPPKWNPFVNPVVRVTSQGNLLVSNCGTESGKLNEGATSFSASLLQMFLASFSTEENVLSREVVTTEMVQNSGPFDSSFGTVATSQQVRASGDSSGFVLYLISPYGNREESVQNLTSAIRAQIDWTQIQREIEAKRDSDFDKQNTANSQSVISPGNKQMESLENTETVFGGLSEVNSNQDKSSQSNSIIENDSDIWKI